MKKDKLEDLKIAIVYDRVNSEGGAERVLTELKKAFPQAILYTSVYDPQGASWAREWTVKTSWLQKIPWLRSRHRLLGWLMPLIFETMRIDQAQVIISVTSEAAKAVITKPEQLHICYLLTPTRYLWSHISIYDQQLSLPLRWLWQRLRLFWQKWDQMQALRPDVIVPISKVIKKRAKQYYDLIVEDPIYPPPARLPVAKKPPVIPNKSFFFTWGRHVPYKRFGVLIEAAVATQQLLLIAGKGPATLKWQHFATQLDPQKQYVNFLGEITDEHLAWYLKRAQAAVFAMPDDFGLAPMEAQLQGCPVIVHQDSGVAEVLNSANCGVFVSEVNSQTIAQAMQEILNNSWQRLDIKRQASQYAGVEFSQEWRQLVATLWRKHQTIINKKITKT